jgi:sugar phosphate isomerase/epimerase
MSNLNVPLGIQSWCFRGFKTNPEVCVELKKCGVDAIELCGAHVDFNNPDSVQSAIATYKDAGIRILATGVNYVTGDAAKDKNVFEFLRLAGVKYMSVDFPVGIDKGGLANIEAIADEYDVRLGIHNHGGKHWLGSPQILRHIFSNTGKRIGLWLDTAWMLDAGGDPVGVVKEFGDRVYGLHIKDFTFDTARRPTDVVVGTGNLDLPALATALNEVGFDGPAIIEYEGDVENPVPALTQCVEQVRKAFA